MEKNKCDFCQKIQSGGFIKINIAHVNVRNYILLFPSVRTNTVLSIKCDILFSLIFLPKYGLTLRITRWLACVCLDQIYFQFPNGQKSFFP